MDRGQEFSGLYRSEETEGITSGLPVAEDPSTCFLHMFTTQRFLHGQKMETGKNTREIKLRYHFHLQKRSSGSDMEGSLCRFMDMTVFRLRDMSPSQQAAGSDGFMSLRLTEDVYVLI